MASGTFTGTTSNEYITPCISWSSTSNTTTNQSSLTVRFQLKKSSLSTSSTYGTGSWVMTIGGSTYSFSDTITIKTNNTYMTVYSKTVTLSHDDDGSKSVAIKVTGGISGTTYTSTSLSKTIELDTIPRSSSFSMVSSMNTGSSLAITITPSSNTFRHKFQFEIDGTVMHTSNYVAAGTKSFSYGIPHSWLPSANSKIMKVYCYTYPASGNDYIARVIKNVTVNVPSNIKPSISNVTPTVVSGLNGKYVVGKSKVKLSVTATTENTGTSIASYIYKGANIDGIASVYTGTSASRTSSIIQSVGSKTYTVIAKDKRGRESDPVTVSIVVQAYSQPQITSITAHRCLSNGILDTNGTCAKVTIKTSYSTVDGANKRVVKLYSSKDNFTVGTTVLSADSTSNTYTGVYGSDFETNTTYTIKAVITDSYVTTNDIDRTTILGVAERTVNIAKHGNGVSVGGLSTQTSSSQDGLFECHWGSKFYDLLVSTGGIRTEADGVNNRYFEARRTNAPAVTDDEHNNVKLQLYVGDSGYPTCRNQYSVDDGSTWTTRSYWKLQDDGFYANGFRVPEIQRGVITIIPSAANTPTSRIVAFDKEFSGSPVITASPHTSVPGTTVLGVSTAERSSTGFTMWLTRANTTETSINWIAVY